MPKWQLCIKSMRMNFRYESSNPTVQLPSTIFWRSVLQAPNEVTSLSHPQALFRCMMLFSRIRVSSLSCLESRWVASFADEAGSDVTAIEESSSREGM